ncbi:hypothetical protein B0J11DRAFT_40519 [Dendryphion nanum]|uniref:BZIP transcription factor n=1 Tax=Dendryphion nanum TaxID=256645 RepID=A0A9P9IZ83_9PLEO|nr:hypothetical protein B0J11DRAFT_40519 [Dendryphion nanum]
MAGADASPDPSVVGDEQNDSSSQLLPASKKRKAGAGNSSRGVANLTPEQLARKRANDREAQRAIRERTKNQIDRLNQRISELESQQPYNDLQVVLREKEAIQAENADIRKRLESVISIIQPILRASGGLNELAAAAERSPLHLLPVPPHPPSVVPSPRDLPSHPVHHHRPLPLPHDPPPHHHDARNLSAHGQHPALHDTASPQNGASSPAGTEPSRPWLYPGDGPTSHLRRYPGDSPQFEQLRPPPHTQQQPGLPFDERLGVDFLLDNNNAQRGMDASHSQSTPSHPPQSTSNDEYSSPGQHAPSLIPYRTLPRNIAPTCPLDVIMLDFLADRQARAGEGVPIKTLVGPVYPNFTSLVYPERNVDAHPLSKLFTDILRTFPDICGIPEQVAIVFIMFLIMRWQIEPSQENYDRLPDWVTPRASQLFVPHPVWVDHIPWPRLRDRIITNPPSTPFDAFFIPFTTTISLNWPYEPRDCLLPASKINPTSLSSTSSMPASSPYSTAVHAGSPPGPMTPQPAASTPGTTTGLPMPKEDDQWLINPAFESHLRDLNNWSLGPSFRNTFPTFGDAVRIKEGR